MQVCIILAQMCISYVLFCLIVITSYATATSNVFPPSGSLLCRLSKTLDDAEESQNVGCFLRSRGEHPHQTFEKSTSTNLHMFPKCLQNRLVVHLCKLQFGTPEIASQICCRNSREICMHDEATKTHSSNNQMY